MRIYRFNKEGHQEVKVTPQPKRKATFAIEIVENFKRPTPHQRFFKNVNKPFVADFVNLFCNQDHDE